MERKTTSRIILKQLGITKDSGTPVRGASRYDIAITDKYLQNIVIKVEK